jgi:hypothetical protein
VQSNQVPQGLLGGKCGLGNICFGSTGVKGELRCIPGGHRLIGAILFVKVRAESVISVGAAALLDMPALLDELHLEQMLMYACVVCLLDLRSPTNTDQLTFRSCHYCHTGFIVTLMQLVSHAPCA